MDRTPATNYTVNNLFGLTRTRAQRHFQFSFVGKQDKSTTRDLLISFARLSFICIARCRMAALPKLRWTFLLPIMATCFPSFTCLKVTTSTISVGTPFAKTRPWTMRPSGLNGAYPQTARRMHSAACGDDRLIIASNHHVEWVAGQWSETQGIYEEVSVGRVSEYKINEDGTATLLSNKELE